ncbi:MAG: AbrB/MazE/SpoVT family DNA-binding domain-containing protein [Chloroflexi bacterium]|nr:AbrB/MazE/SpoVT family DNA-binding domain-containing protein [Chloroflexota bacterium]
MPERGPVTRIVRQLRGGQITIPSDFRRELGIDEQSYLKITLGEGELRIAPLRVSVQPKGSGWPKELYEQFAPARQAATGHTEGEVNADIDRAVADVRRTRAARRL